MLKSKIALKRNTVHLSRPRLKPWVLRLRGYRETRENQRSERLQKFISHTNYPSMLTKQSYQQNRATYKTFEVWSWEFSDTLLNELWTTNQQFMLLLEHRFLDGIGPARFAEIQQLQHVDFIVRGVL